MLDKSTQLLQLTAPNRPLVGTVTLPSSKSIANRYLILQALSKGNITIHNMSDSDDSQILQALLAEPPSDGIYDAHHAGTTSRFLLAYLALQPGTQVITGSDRLKTRPIRPLADALRSLGCNLEYLETEGCLPIRVHNPPAELNTNVSVEGSVSSQFISALLLNAHSLPNGLTVNILGEWISRPYIEMTLAILRSVGIQSTLTDTSITIAPQSIQPTTLTVEADWSAASYFLGLTSMLPGANLLLPNLYADSIQGDSGMLDYLKYYGVSYAFQDGGLRVWNTKTSLTDYPPLIEMDLEATPDIFQTLATLHGYFGIQCLYTGLSTLAGKETDRFAAMKAELGKLDGLLYALPKQFSKKSAAQYYMQEGKCSWKSDLQFATYQDHRMAMSLAMLSLLGPIRIEDPSVVSKSFPRYWEELEKLGFGLMYF